MYIYLAFFSLALLWTHGQTQGSDQQCYANRDTFVPDTPVRFAFMISMRKKDSSKVINNCALINKDALQNYLAAEWVVERMNKANNGTGYIPGIKIGFDVLDDCQSPEAASRNALTFVEGWLPSWLKNCTKPTNSINIGIIGPSRSTSALRVASLLRDINVTIISYAATNAELTKTTYPTFLRTVPSDVDQMTMIASLMKQLNWTFVVIAHKSNEYGTSGAKLLKAKSEELGICVQDVLPIIDFNHNSDFTKSLISLLLQSKGSSLALVFIGSRDDAENLMFMINNMAPQNRINKFGLHVILSDSANTDDTIYKDKEYGYGTFSVATSAIILQDVLSDLQAKFRRVREKSENHKLIQEFIDDFPKEELFADNHHNAFIPMTIHAIFALVEAFKTKYTQLCGGAGNLCKTLLDSLQLGELDLVSSAANVKVRYKDMDPNIPPNWFSTNNYAVSFDAEGNMKQTNQDPLYTVYQYQEKYIPVGFYRDSQLHLNTSLIKMKTSSGDVSTIQTSVCQNFCDKCVTKGKIPISVMPGDFYILGIFSIHDQDDDPYQCGPFRNFSNDAIAAEGFFFAVKKLSALTGINFGAIAIDDCYSPVRATTILSSYFYDETNEKNPLFESQISISKIVGVVGCLSSSCTLPIATFFTPHRIPVISYSSSTPDLDDKLNYPYFLRTVPSDMFQARVMLQVIQKMNWQYVGLIYIKNNYGTKAMKAFKALAATENSSVCVAEEIGIGAKSSDLDEGDFFRVFSKLTAQQVKVVVFFGIHVRYLAFLQYLEQNKKYGTFIFLGSEDWGKYKNIIDAAPKASRGSITLKLEEIRLESDDEFQSYLAARTPEVNDVNIWFSEFWQNEFQCNLPGGFMNIFDRDCNPSLKLTPESVATRSNEQRLKQAINAVYALGSGWNEARSSECENVADCLRQKVDKVVEKIKAVKRKQDYKQFMVFDSEGNGAIGFTIYNVQQVDQDKNTYFKVGTFSSNDSCLQTKDMLFYSDSGQTRNEISALCTPLLCAHCPKMYITQKASEAVAPVPLADYRNTDILLISLIIVLILALAVTVAAMWICLNNKYSKLLEKFKFKNSEEIYAEPDGLHYQPYSETHGIKFANNELDPYPQEEANTMNPLLRGITNPSFVPDNADVISQVNSLRNRSGSQLLSRSNTLRTSMSRPLPISPISDNAMSEIFHDNMAYLESVSDVPYLPSGATSSQIAHNSNNSSMRAGSAQFVLLPNVGGNTSEGSETVLYRRNSSRPSSSAGQQRTLSHQPSVRSNSSIINPDFGPYSYAAAQRQRMMQNSSVQPGDFQPALQELNIQNTHLAHQENNAVPQQGYKNDMEYVPLHYASTSVASRQTPGPQVLPSPDIHPSLMDESTRAYFLQQMSLSGVQALEMSNMNRRMSTPEDQHYFLTNSSRPQYENSMVGSPDHNNPPHDIQPQVSMESIDLNSHIDTQNEVTFSQAGQTPNNGNFFTRLIKGGNVTNV
ncbi:metabotropic glutamate receptor 5 [Biomphalaria pfeifferi]|uniref:Metabotropic glutamate receptor 5 n=1 Tax=Biomphalaria pfeifferi TaxID=112525 RepID=A0AAD8EYP4_BIOPF|nr:metabotropic glutamate receptor 5 [Biomphalaria pfeifferi]